MLGRLAMMARGAGAGFKAGISGNFMRSMAGASGYLAGRSAGAFMRTPTGMGMAAGAGWGMLSDDTSVIGGALMGGLAGRYGGSAIRRGMLGRRGIGVGGGSTVTGMRGFGLGAMKGIRNRFMGDFGSARVRANQGYNKIKGLF